MERMATRGARLKNSTVHGTMKRSQNRGRGGEGLALSLQHGGNRKNVRQYNHGKFLKGSSWTTRSALKKKTSEIKEIPKIDRKKKKKKTYLARDLVMPLLIVKRLKTKKGEKNCHVEKRRREQEIQPKSRRRGSKGKIHRCESLVD